MTKSYLPVQVQAVWLALEANGVQEILGPRPFIAIPGASRFVSGVTSWRGRAVAILDLGRVATGADGPGPRETRRRTVIVQMGKHALALPVDAVLEVVEVAESELRPPHATKLQLASAEIEIKGRLMPTIAAEALIGLAAAGEGT